MSSMYTTSANYIITNSKFVKTMTEKNSDLEASIKLFDAKFEGFTEAWNSSNAIAVKNKIENIKTNLEKAKNSLTTVYNKIDRTTTNIEIADSENF